MVNIGRRDGAARGAHLTCEFEVRLAAAGLCDRGYDLPMTQEQIGDAVGLTSAHVARTLKQLEREGLIAGSRRAVRIADRQALQERADSNRRYLHLDEVPESDSVRR